MSCFHFGWFVIWAEHMIVHPTDDNSRVQESDRGSERNLYSVSAATVILPKAIRKSSDARPFCFNSSDDRDFTTYYFQCMRSIRDKRGL
jgi:hypothetical protein